MKVRKLHRIVAIVMSPFLFFLATTGCVLFFRKSGLYDKEIKDLFVALHTWEIIGPYVGLFMGLGLFLLLGTGLILFFKKGA